MYIFYLFFCEEAVLTFCSIYSQSIRNLIDRLKREEEERENYELW